MEQAAKNILVYVVNKRLLWQLSLGFVFVVSIFILHGTMLASNADITRHYNGDINIKSGTLVSLKNGASNYLVLANSNTKNDLIGVAVSDANSLVELNNDKGNIGVAIAGNAVAIVSSVYGDIEIGDQISDSPINGVGAKARPGSKTIGIAIKSFKFSESSNKQKIKDNNGNYIDVAVGFIPVMVTYAANSVSDKNEPSSIEKWAASLAGHDVSITRLIICGVIASIAIVSLIIMVYSSIRNAITAVSRNPLAKPMIFEALAQVMVMVVIVALISLITSYLVIRL